MNRQAVIFDLFGTLIRPFAERRFSTALARMADAIGLPGEFLADQWNRVNEYARHTGTFGTIAQELRVVASRHTQRVFENRIQTAVEIRYEFTRSTLDPRRDAVSTLTQLKGLGVGRGLISDCSPDVPDLWEETPFAPLIDDPVFSCSVRLKKPDPEIYKLACQRLKCAPQDCVYVGDGFSRELSGAQAVGIRPFLLRPDGEAPPKSEEWEGHSWDGETLGNLGDVLSVLGL